MSGKPSDKLPMKMHMSFLTDASATSSGSDATMCTPTSPHAPTNTLFGLLCSCCSNIPGITNLHNLQYAKGIKTYECLSSNQLYVVAMQVSMERVYDCIVHMFNNYTYSCCSFLSL